MPVIKKISFTLLTFLFLVFGNSSSSALSCDALYNRVFAECSHTECKKIFFIEDIPGASGGCFRRPKISATPEWAQAIIEAEVQNSKEFNDKKVFNLLILKKYWHGSEEPISFNNYVKFKNGAFSSNPEDVFRSTYNAPKLTIIDDKNFSQVKTEWEKKVHDQNRKELFSKVANWTTFILSLIALFISVKWFRQERFKNKPKKYFYISLSIQLTLFVLANLILIGSQIFLVAYHLLLVPIVWLYEIVFSLVIRRRERQENSNLDNTSS